MSDLIQKSGSAIKATVVFKSLSQGFGLLATILIVRGLSEMHYGIYNLLYTLIALFYMVASLGINNTLQRYIPEYYQKKEFVLAHRLYTTLTFLRLLANTLLMGLILMLWDHLAPLLKLEGYKAYFIVFTLIIFLDMQRTMIDTCLSSFFLQKYSKSIGCLFSLTKVIGYTSMMLLDQSLWWALAADLAAYAIVFTALQILYFKKIPRTVGSQQHYSPAEKKRVFRYALFYNFNDAGDGMLNSYFDNIIIAMMLTPVAVGAYSFCITMVTMIGGLLPLKYFKEIVHASFFSSEMASSSRNIRMFFQQLAKINLIFTLPCFCFLVLHSDEIIRLFFGGKFIEYAPVLCGIFFFFEVLFFPFAMVAQLREKAKIIFYSKIFAVYNLIADIIFIYFWGIWGAMIATGTAVLGKNLFIWRPIKKDANFTGMAGFYSKMIVFWTLGTAIAYFFDCLFLVSYYKLGMGILVFFALFFLQFQCRLFTREEKQVFQAFSCQYSKLSKLFKTLKLLPESR